MANPTTFSRPVQNPAVHSTTFPKTDEGRAKCQQFVDEKRAEGFRVVVTQKFGGRDMKTKQSFKVMSVHCFEPTA